MKIDTTYVSIDLDAITRNFQAISQKAGVPVMAVIKADAYGHGAVPVAEHLKDLCAFFGVSSMLEALELRQAGLKNPILILGYTPPAAFDTAVQENIRPTIFTWEDAEKLSAAAQKVGAVAPFHFAVDTGMSRIGFQVTEESADICAKIAKLPGLVPEGLFSHFATADCRDLTKAKAQAALFDRFYEMLCSRGVAVAMRHLDNSAGLMQFDTHYEMVRAGIVLYGLYPSSEVEPSNLPLQPALSWYSHITHIKTLPKGRELSYGGTFVTEKDTVVATVPVGYADGYRRSLSNRFYVRIQGKPARILGRVCMDQMMVDVTDIPLARVGDTVTLLGNDGGEITAEEMAQSADTFNYELVCGISRRVPRRYLRDGKTVRQVHYLLDT